VLGLFSDERIPVRADSVRAAFYRLADPEKQPREAEPAGEAQLTPRSLTPSTNHKHPDGSVHAHDGRAVTAYVVTHEFDRVGLWGGALEIELDGKRYSPQVTFFVQEHTSEPAVGDPAPPSVQRTTAEAPIEEIDSSIEPNPDLHDTAVADAVASGRPAVIAFVTPAFCQTQFCGPVLEQVVLPAWEQYRERVEFIHIEPYDLKQAREAGRLVPLDIIREWGLVSEPFVFVVDAEGKIAAKFEGIMEAEELAAAIEQVLE
jgi:hypothetical protein